ncbi:T9SS type A sorting domain-containing protein [Larkinella soli]|uniref:T9SS type A sorting domain-containing protein n=1 Tax=Larkinella soli TaxID=1770527 RepID=UPI000FFB35D6|nr:T9SS type A sorting domain-containing protein [Larkinella soli]
MKQPLTGSAGSWFSKTGYRFPAGGIQSLLRISGLLTLFLSLWFSASAQTGRPLTLPFFDDFSTVTSRPDPTLWQAGGNVYINNTLPINHPSVNVATFDGLKATGAPYDFTNSNAVGPTDTLTSLPIDLSGYTAADAVFLSFYWERKGLGELPDESDTLRLQFLNNTGVWKTVWKEMGAETNNNFVQTFVAVDRAEFMHAGFRFRFEAFGRLSGPFDSWHLDYIYLNRGRSAGDRFVKDIATRQAVTPYLKRYTAMPLKQYLANPAAETADSVRTDIVNLFNNFNFTTFRFLVRDEVSGRQVQDYQQTLSENIGSLSSQVRRVKPQPLPADFSGKRTVLRYTFDVLTTDDQNPSIPGVNLRRNDSISGVTVLDDYFAYDDGTAETALNVNQRQGRAGMRFILNVPDVVSGARINFVQISNDLTGRPFVLSVYGSNRGRPGNLLYQQSFVLKYPQTRNGFVDFKFDYGVAVKDTFYIGWTQLSEESLLAVGFDKNSPFGNQVFVNLGTSWEPGGVTGAPMFRPIIGGLNTAPITGIEEEPAALSALRVFPNPNPGVLTWDHPALRRVEVLDLNGRPLLNVQPTEGQRQLDVGSLGNGFYLVRLSDGKRTVTQKLIISK